MNTNDRKMRLGLLLQKQKEKERKDELQRQVSLMLEPFSSKENIYLLDVEEKEKMKTELLASFPIIEWVSLDLKKMNNYFVINQVNSEKVASFFNEKNLCTDNPVYLFLQDDLPPFSTLPWVKMPLAKIIEQIVPLAAEDAYLQYVFSPSPKFVIEFIEPERITIAW